MLDLDGLVLGADTEARLPPAADIDHHLHNSVKRRAVDVLADAVVRRRPVVQPRCGVGRHSAMLALLRSLDHSGAGLLTVTIDAHTRLKRFATAARTLEEDPDHLNGYPLVAHGWKRGRELDQSVVAPLQLRHGSPDPRDLFAVALAAGITSFEGGGVSYNLPYSKDVPLARSLEAWRQVDAVCGRLAEDGVVVDRELFGTLTGVLMPPSLCLAVAMLEAVAASRQGVRCVSVAYPQGGEAHQDIAALRSIAPLAERYLPASVQVFAVLHEFMGPFPQAPDVADALIFYGALVGRLGGAAKIVTKTNQEAFGIPDAGANVHGVRTAALACSELLDFIELDQDRIEEESHWIEREVVELVDPVLQGKDLATSIEAAFRAGTLDIPFSASIHARSDIIPARDAGGAIRYLFAGRLPFAKPTCRRNDTRLGPIPDKGSTRLMDRITGDINYFARKGSP